MKTNYSFGKRLLAMLLSIAMIAAYLPGMVHHVAAATPADTVTDPGTAYTWESMMGTDVDGNRYAGRVWVDKSVYKQGDTAVLNTKNESGSSFQVHLEEDEAFQVVFSALGSSMTTKSTSVSSGPMDVVLILDNSTSMDDVIDGTTRLEKVITASNELIGDLLQAPDIRLGITSYNGDADTVLPFGRYTDGVTLSVDNYLTGGVISAYSDSRVLLGRDDGYNNGTNTQSGYDLAMRMLLNADGIQDRYPVVILLTDGAANTAVDKSFYDITKGTVRQRFFDGGVPVGVALSTLLNASYMKASVEDHYGKTPMVYGVGVDLADNDGAEAIINPGSQNGFNSSNENANIREAYRLFSQQWARGNTATKTHSGYSFSFDHRYPAGSTVTDADVIANINYVDTYYSVTSQQLEETFTQIYEELSSSAFNPISSSTTVDGATGVQNTPLIYVDFIGQHMEIKEIQSVTLFGASYGVVKNADGTYTVAGATGTNPTTNEAWNTAEDILISVTEQTDGTQKLEIRINQEILPIIMEQVVSETVGDDTTATITEFQYNPLRVFYTVGLDSDILLPSGQLDASAIRGYSHIDGAAGTATFYSNRFGVMNPASGGTVANGDAHVGFKPSKENRYYYHQTNQDIFTAVSAKNGAAINWQADEYGVRYEEGKFDFTWLTYDNYNNLGDNDEVYTYVTYYHPTPSTADAATAAEEVTYLVYTNWGYLKESVAFYDHDAEVYINYHETSGYTTGDVGYAIPVDKVTATINAYKQANPNADIYGMLGVESLRTSRLHNMLVAKTLNDTDTAVNRYSPEYTHETASVHNGNDVVVWLGNNGKLTVDIETGIALTKEVTEAIGNANDTYALTVTVPNGVSATPVVMDNHGNDVTSTISTYTGNVLTVNVKAGETVFVSGIPAGTECQIGENIPADKDYYVQSKTAIVTVPTLTEVLGGADQFAPAKVTNAPNKYGDLTIIKDIHHDLTEVPADMADKVFSFEVELDPVPVKKTYQVDAASASLFTGNEITVGPDGSFTVTLKDNESITIMDLPENTAYTVTEVNVPAGYTNTTGTVSGAIEADGDHDAHFVNEYGYTPIKPQITITGEKTVTSYGSTYSGAEEFVFELSHYVGVSATNQTGYEVLGTAQAKDGESYEFKLDTLLTQELGIGEHYFRVTEQSGTTAGMSYDSTRGMFRVVLTDTDADGVLEVAVENVANTQVSNNAGFVVEKDFNNIYDVDKTHVDINIQKILDNDTGVDIPLNSFHFTLVNKANANEVYNVTTDAAGKATIRIPELDKGTYEYELAEAEDAAWLGMNFDSQPRTVIVTVTENGGVLQVDTKIDGNTTNNVTFRNKYELTGTSYTISGTKVLSGRDLADREFTFALYETDSSFDLPANAVAEETVENSGNSFAFTQINYTQVGTYYYSVKEVKGSKAGVTYDTTHYHITVTVSVDGAGLKADAVINKIGHNEDNSSGIVFVNTYAATPTEYAISGTKILTGRAMAAGEFTFELYEGDVKKGEATNKADGTFTFDAITYYQPGTYTYTVKEVEGNKAGVTYTNAEVEVTVTVTDTNAVLSAEANKTAAEIRLVNTYDAADATVTFGGTKTLEGGTLADNSFTFHLYETDHTFNIAGKTPEEKTNVNGAFTFDTITLNATGTYFYAIVEDAANPLEGIVYDRTQHNYMVQVSDIGDGQLKAVVTNVDTGDATPAAASVAVNAAFTNATFDEAVEKEVYLANNTATHIDGQQVAAGDELTYFITYENFTGQAVVVDIMDTIPNHTTYVDGSASHGGTYAGKHVNWILNVGKGESVTVSFSVKVDEAEAIVANTAVVRDGVNIYTTNEVINHTVEEPLKKDVFTDSAVSVDGQAVEAGDELTYRITYTNASGQPVNIQITDTVPTNTTYVEGSADNGGVYSDGVLTWQIADVPAWSSVTVEFKVTVNEINEAAVIENVATATDGINNYTTNKVTNQVEFVPEETTEPVEPTAPSKPAEPAEKPTAPSKPATPAPETPQTGDSFQAFTFITLMVLSSFGLAAVMVCKNREQDKEKAE